MSNGERLKLFRFTFRGGHPPARGGLLGRLLRSGEPGASEARLPTIRFPDLCACCGARARERLAQEVLHGALAAGTLAVPYCRVCLVHVKGREVQFQKAANTGVVVGLLLYLATMAIAFFMAPDRFSLVARLGILPCMLLGLVVGVLIGMKGIRARGEPLRQTGTCTVPVDVETETVRSDTIPGESELAVHVYVGSAEFASEFEELNREAIERKAVLEATVERTPRGDLVVLERMPTGRGTV